MSVRRRSSLQGTGVFVAAALCLAGCGPGREPGDFAVPATPVMFSNQHGRAAAPVDDWPRSFGSRELASLADQAQAENFDIAAALARIEQASAQARVAGSTLYPQVNASENASRSLTPGTLRSKTPPFKGSIGSNFNLGLTASYMLDLFGRNRALRDAAEISVEVARYNRDAVTVATLASLANLYFQILGDQERIRLSVSNVAAADRVLQAIRARLAVGTATALDVAQQESVVANQRASVPALRQSIGQNRNLIAVLIGQTPQSRQVKGGSLRAIRLPVVRAGLPSQLLLRRPDIAAAEANLEVQNASVTAARAAFFPTITLTANLGLESISLANLLRPEALAASLAQGLTAPIFNGGNLQGQLDLARGRQTELLEIYRRAIVTALSDVENALIAVRETTNHERLQGLAVAAATRAYQITQERLREGTIDVVTLLNTQTTLFQSQDQLVATRTQRLQAIVSLYQALGGGWTFDSAAVVRIVADAGVPSSIAAAIPETQP